MKLLFSIAFAKTYLVLEENRSFSTLHD